MPDYQPISDPFPGKGPILTGTPGFYKRVEVFTTVQDLLRAGDSVSLVGERKAGKTSFLNYLLANLSVDEFIPVFVDAQGVAPKTDQMFLGWLARNAARAIAQMINLETEPVQATGGASEEETPVQQYLSRLLHLLDDHFDEEDLRTFCFHLGVDHENLPAIGKANKARELLMHLQRRGRVTDLIRTGKQLRPDVPWKDVPTVPKKASPSSPLEIATLKVRPNEAYLAFQDDLDRLRVELPLGASGQKRRLVWLIDEIETLRGYEKTELFTFLRPLAQSDQDFRLVVAGYDVLYTLSTRSEWSPFYNAFRHVRLDGLNPVVAQELIDDALKRVGLTIDQNLYEPILDWTGQKPYFLKWTLSKIAEAINQQEEGYYVNIGGSQRAQNLFLNENDLGLHFAHLWQTHTTIRQRTILSLIAAQPGPYTYQQIFDNLKAQKLLEEDVHTWQQLLDDLTRLKQLGFLYEQVGRYTFTSGCLQAWIQKNKPL
jgi:hypothetical protein